MQDSVKKAFQSAETELEEKEVQHLKSIILRLLENKAGYKKSRDEYDDKIRLVDAEIADFKAGRLDKIQERHEKNPKCKEVSPITIVVVQDNRHISYPTQPWKWNYEVVWGTPNHYVVTSSGSSTINAVGGTFLTAGSTAATFTQGSYTVGTSVINL